jgi:hypothetical protein
VTFKFRPRGRASDADRAERERRLASNAPGDRAADLKCGLVRRGMGSGAQKCAPNPAAVVDYVTAVDEAERHPLLARGDVGPPP